MSSSQTLTLASLQKIPVSFATCSLHPSPSTSLPDILHAISSAGFGAIELSFPNLVSHATALSSRRVTEDDYATLCGAAEDVARICASLGLEIILLQPFANFEGWPLGSPDRRAAFDRAAGWIEIMLACGCATLQVGSTDSAVGASVSRADVVRDLRELGGMLAARGLRLAYENWCWSTHAPGWRDVWAVVAEVDMENVGLCLDTFQSAGGEWGDPTTRSGRVELEGGGGGEAEVTRRWERSLGDLARTVPPEKIFLLQVSDAYRLTEPLEDTTIDGLRPRGRWSHDYRPLVGEGRGYLPCADFARAVSRTGFRGWWSYEVFDWPDWETRAYNDGRDLGEYAMRAKNAHVSFLKEVAED